MRTLRLALVLVVIACRSTPTAEPLSNRAPPPLAVQIELADTVRERIAVGFALDLELRLGDITVGACTLAFDLWDEVYRVDAKVVTTRDPVVALRGCVDTRKLRTVQTSGIAAVRVQEAPPRRPLYRPPAYPVF